MQILDEKSALWSWDSLGNYLVFTDLSWCEKVKNILGNFQTHVYTTYKFEIFNLLFLESEKPCFETLLLKLVSGHDTPTIKANPKPICRDNLNLDRISIIQ